MCLQWLEKMSKNILIMVNYKLKEFYYKGDSSDYSEICSVCYKSFKKNLMDLDEVIILTGIEKNYNKMFKDKFYKIMDIHRNGDCNILYVDTDTVCIKDTEIFGKFNFCTSFCICNDLRYRKYTALVPINIYKSLNPWFMCSVQYYPSSMDKKLWDIGESLAKNWINVWAYECIIYNSMIHAQNVNLKKLHDPRFNYQYLEEFKMSIPLEEAHIVHVPATRGSNDSLRIMKRLFNGG